MKENWYFIGYKTFSPTHLAPKQDWVSKNHDIFDKEDFGKRTDTILKMDFYGKSLKRELIPSWVPRVLLVTENLKNFLEKNNVSIQEYREVIIGSIPDMFKDIKMYEILFQNYPKNIFLEDNDMGPELINKEGRMYREKEVDYMLGTLPITLRKDLVKTDFIYTQKIQNSFMSEKFYKTLIKYSGDIFNVRKIEIKFI